MKSCAVALFGGDQPKTLLHKPSIYQAAHHASPRELRCASWPNKFAKLGANRFSPWGERFIPLKFKACRTGALKYRAHIY